MLNGHSSATASPPHTPSLATAEREDQPAPPGDASFATDAKPDLSGLDVLLVEDSVLIALDTEDMLYDIGVASVRVAATVNEALSRIGERCPDFAFLDFDLGTETSLGIAEQLAADGVPFAFASGYGEGMGLEGSLAKAQVLEKPYTASELLLAITACRAI